MPTTSRLVHGFRSRRITLDGPERARASRMRRVWNAELNPGADPERAAVVAEARAYTQRLVNPIYGFRLPWHRTDFACLFLPVADDPAVSRWDERRRIANENYADAKTPSRPMLPVAIERLAMAMTVVEPCECSVTPRP